MANHPERLLRHMRALLPCGEDHADSELLARFACGDERAFAALVSRYEGMVRGVCRRVLRDADAAEDVAQSTFLALAERAGSLRRPASLASWLHEAARNLALKQARSDQRRQRRELRGLTSAPCPDPLDEVSVRELLAIFDEEVRQLPEQYRLPLILCCLEGCTLDSAARRLGWTPGSVKGRLERGRALLHGRLIRRGVTLPAALGVLGIGSAAQSAPLVMAAARGPLVNAKVALVALLAVGVVTVGAVLGVGSRPAADKPAGGSKAEVRVDRHGDPLPAGAVGRLGTVRWRAADSVDALAFSPDDRTLAAAGTAGVCLFDAHGRRVQRLNPGSTYFDRLAYSPDGQRLICRALTAVNDRTKRVVQIWDVPNGRMQQQFDVRAEWVGWSVRGEPLAVVLTKSAVALREMHSGKEQRFPADALPFPNRHFVCDYVPTAKVLVATDLNSAIHVWDVPSGKKLLALETKADNIRHLALSPDGRRLAWIERDGDKLETAQFRDVGAGAPLCRVSVGQRYLRSVAFTPDCKTLVTVGWTDTRFVDVASHRERHRLKGVTSFAPGTAFSSDGRTLATSEAYSRAIHRWDIATGSMREEPVGHTTSWPGSVAFSPDGLRLASTGGNDDGVFVWVPWTGELRTRYATGRTTRGCAYSADGRTLFTSWTDDKLRLLDADTMRVQRSVDLTDAKRPDVEESGLDLHLSEDRKSLVVLSDSSAKKRGAVVEATLLVTAWDVSTFEVLFRRRRTRHIFGVAVSPDLRVLAVGGGGTAKSEEDPPGGRPVRLEDLRTGQQLLSLPKLEKQTRPVAFSLDGRLLATNTFGPLSVNRGRPGEDGHTLRLWDVKSAGEVLDFPSVINARIAFTADGRLAALSAPGPEILVWDLRRGKEHALLKGFGADIASLAFSPDGRRLVSGLSDTTLLVWDVPAISATPSLDATGAEKAWAGLAGDARTAFAARGALAGSPVRAVALLREQLKPVAPADAGELLRLIRDLDSDQFAAREKSRQALEALGDRAGDALRKALDGKPGLEFRRRVEALLAGQRGPVNDASVLQAMRAVAVLEDIGTPESKKILEGLVAGAPGARLTVEAQKALARLSSRPGPSR